MPDQTKDPAFDESGGRGDEFPTETASSGPRGASPPGAEARASPDRAKPPARAAWRAQNGSKRWYWRYPLAAEWGMEWFVYRLRSLALFDLLELVGRCTVLVVAIFWVLEADNRAKERHYRAWDLINSARGSTSDGGRRDALQDLNKDHVSLAGAPLEKAFLIRVDLKGADLMGANLEGTYLVGANLERTSLGAANLEGALLIGANLKGADLRGANLEGADLVGADLEDADLQHANLQRVNTSQFLSHLDELDLSKYLGANLNLQGANLWDANLQGANLASAGNLTQKQLDRANGNNHTQLPKGLARPARWSK